MTRATNFHFVHKRIAFGPNVLLYVNEMYVVAGRWMICGMALRRPLRRVKCLRESSACPAGSPFMEINEVLSPSMNLDKLELSDVPTDGLTPWSGERAQDLAVNP